MKKGRVVILLAGRRAGKKAVIVKQIDEAKKVSNVIDLGISFNVCAYRTESSPTPSWSELNVPQERLPRA